MKKKIIFLDIDGTLTEAGSNEPPASALQAIRAAQDKGNYIFLCSGRNYGMLSPLLSYGFDGVIASAGGYIRFGDEVIYDCPMEQKQQNKLMSLFSSRGIYRTVESFDRTYTDESFKDFLRANADKGNNSELLRWREQIESSLNIRPMEEYAGEPVYKMIIMSETKDQMMAAYDEFKEDFYLCIQDEEASGIINGEIINRKFDKGKGVERVCAYLNIPVEDTIAFGDSMNDLEMIETAGVGICMENGSEALKKAADDICPSVGEDGLFYAFSKYNLM